MQGFSSAEAFLKSNQLHDTACLILDVRMPGMSGLELQRQLVVDAIVESRLSSSPHMKMTTRERGHLKPGPWSSCTNPSGKRRCLMQFTQLSSLKGMEQSKQSARNSRRGESQTLAITMANFGVEE